MTSHDDETEIRALVQRLEDAWNAADAPAWARDCLEDADFINIRGEVLPDRNANEIRHAMMFAGPFRGSRIALSIRRIQHLAPGAALVETDCDLTGAQRMPAGIQVTEAGVLRTRLKHVLVRRDGRWWIAAAQNTAIIPGPP
jgi:uncharacterized protein (TIGR02246 family)